ncbi:hypothetical protein IAT40_006298 [Kwoniella sp. CBS 6097]
MSTESIIIHPPGSDHPSLSEQGFDRSWFMGRWGVAWSTLPMWKNKKDVSITYTPVADQTKINTTFDDLVEYRKMSAANDSKTSTVKGVDTLTPGTNGATFDWKGSSYLFFVHSHWEVLGYGRDEINGLEWGVTFFSKTLFTPAGIDIYLRTSPSNPQPAATDPAIRKHLLESIVAAIGVVEDQGVKSLAKGGFEVPGVV